MFANQPLSSFKFNCDNQDIWTNIQENVQLICSSCKAYYLFMYFLGNKILVIENGIKKSYDVLVDKNKISYIPSQNFPIIQYYDQEIDRTTFEYILKPNSYILFHRDVDLTHTINGVSPKILFTVELLTDNSEDIDYYTELLELQ